MAWARRIEDCKDPSDYMYCACAVYSCGYSQPKRTNISASRLKAGTAEADCSSMVSWALHSAGYIAQNDWFWTGIEVDYLHSRGFQVLNTSNAPKRNDVLWRNGHTGMFVGDGMQAEALRTERHDAGYNGSAPGDQDGGETVVRAYNASNWTYILRPPARREEPKVAKQNAGNPVNNNGLKYQAHCQDVGWCPEVRDGQSAGTTGFGKRMEAIRLTAIPAGWEIYARAHVAGVGWVDYGTVRPGTVIGSTGKSHAVESLILGVSKRPAGDKRKLYFKVHQANLGWKGKTPEGFASGTDGMGIQLEAVQIWIA